MAYSKKNWIAVAICVLLILIGKFIAPIGALSAQGNAALFLMLALVVVIATEAIPGGLVGFIAVACLPLLGVVSSLAEASTLFGNQLFFYMMSCYAIAAIMGKLPLSRRILLFFVKTFGKTTKGIITALLLTTVILSTFISNFPACMLVLIIAKAYLEMLDEEARKKTRSSLMVGIIIAVAIGGIATPVGSSCAAMASSFLSEAGFPVSFLQWMVIGVPVAIVWFPITMLLLFKFFPPAEMTSEEQRQDLIRLIESGIPEKLSSQEIATIIILAVTFTCWILNFNLMLVTCFCGIALLFPGFKLLSWKDFNESAGWGTTVMVCAMVAVATGMQNTGVIDWFIGMFKSIIPSSASATVMLLIFGAFTAVFLMIIPNGPVLVTVLGSTMIPLAVELGISPAALLIGFACFTTYACIMPIDAISLVVYESGKNFAAKDEPLVGLPVVAVGTVITAVWIPIACKLLGL